MQAALLVLVIYYTGEFLLGGVLFLVHSNGKCRYFYQVKVFAILASIVFFANVLFFSQEQGVAVAATSRVTW